MLMKKKIVISVLSLVSIFVNVPLYAQESCYEQFLSEHNMTILTAEDADDSYEELKKEVIARQRMHEEILSMPIVLAIDTITGTCQILAQDGTILADAYLALVDSTWYMWLSVDPLVDKNISNTPYMYCNGNPVMLIDPLGMNTLNLNSDGTVRNYIKSDVGNDVINYMNGKGEIISSYSMPIRSMDCVYDQDANMKDAQGNDVIRHMFVISIKGDPLGLGAFKFITEEMSGTYEWAFLQTGESGAGKNYISTSGQQGRNCVQGWLIRRLPDSSNIRHVSHHHPTNESYTRGSDDIHAQGLWENLRVKFDPNVIFSIYSVPTQSFVEIPIKR